MSSRHLVDPELAPLLDLFPTMELSNDGLAEARKMVIEMAAAAEPPSLPVNVETRSIAGPAGAPDVPVHIYRPEGVSGPLPAYLHIHGGGYVMGSPALADIQNRVMADALKCLIVSVDYRLSPETTYPGPVEDCYAALLWLHRNADELGVAVDRIAIGGESAGGGLAASLALVARDRGEVPIVLQVLVYPMLDDRTATTRPANKLMGEFVWTGDANIFGWTSYLGHAPGGGDCALHAAPARTSDLSGLPPTYLVCGALDLFLDEDIEYGRRLIHAGVPTEMHIYPGAYHAFDLAAEAEATKAFKESQRAALIRALRPKEG